MTLLVTTPPVRAEESLVHAYLSHRPDTLDVIRQTLEGEFVDGTALVDLHFKPMIKWVYQRIAEALDVDSLTSEQCLLFIQELSVFARYNSHFLRRAGTSVEGSCFELSHEFRRNHLEEGGERGKIPAHYVLYSSALLGDLGILVNGRVPLPETHVLLTLHDLLVDGSSAATICGGYFATEGVAVDETELLREITNRYGELTVGQKGTSLPKLDFYYQLHLDEQHEAASVEGLSVEDAHIEGIAYFIRNNKTFNLLLPEICDGFLQIMIGMSRWWEELTARSGAMA